MSKPARIALAVLVLAARARADHPDFDREFAAQVAQCAAYWFAEHAADATRTRWSQTDGHPQDLGHIYRDAAGTLTVGDKAWVDYVIALDMPRFTRLIHDARQSQGTRPDGGGARAAQDLLQRQQQLCQNTGLKLGPEWGLH